MGKGVTCEGVTQKVGFENGYYLRGNAFAFLDADASIHIPIYGDQSIFDAKVGVVLDFGFPNPSYLEGDFLVEYSVLGGSYEGKQYMKINLGNKPCGELEPNPIVGIKVFKSTFPENGATNVRSLSEIQNNTNVMINQRLIMSQTDKTKVYIKCILDKYEVNDKKRNKTIKTEPSPGVGLNGEGYANNYHGQSLLESLKSNTTYQIKINYKWLRVTSTTGQSDKTELLAEEKVVSEFTTGEADDVITQDLITSQYPGYRQRFWYKGYEKPVIRLKDEINKEQIDKIFPEEVGYKSQVYFVVIKENKKDGNVVYHKTPVMNFPNNWKWKSTFEKDKTLQIPGLDSMNFEKGSFCTMYMFRSVDNIAEYKKLNSLEAMSSDENLAKETAEQKIIYTTHFGISQYNSVYDKLKDVKVTAAIGNSSVVKSKRPMLMSADQIQSIVDMDIETLDVLPKNVYYGIKGTKEGIDSFDYNKIKRQVNMSFDKPANYYNWTQKYYFQYIIFCGNNFIASTEALVNSNRNKVLDKFTDNLRRKDDGFSSTAAENEFTIFFAKGVGNKYELTGDEIGIAKLNSEKVNFTMGEGPYLFSENYTNGEWNPDIIVEDGIASTAALQYLFTKISILKVLGLPNKASDDGEGQNTSKYYGTNKYFTISENKANSNNSSPKKYLMEKYYGEGTSLIFNDPNSLKVTVINMDPEKLLFKDIIK